MLRILKNTLEGKILGITGIVVILSFAVAFTINAVTEIRSLEKESINKSYLIGGLVESSMRTIMLTGNSDIAYQWVEDLRSINRLKELYIIKTNGMLAFRDLDTLREVNQRLGKKLFERDPLPDVRILDENDERLLRILRDQKKIEYILKGREGHVFVQMQPIFNGIKCAKCHAREKDVLGILKIATSMKEVDRGVKNIILSAIAGSLLSSLLVIGLLWLLIRIFVTRPISGVTRTIKDVITKNRLDTVLSYRSRDEIGSMVEDFNTMLRRLNDLYTTLEEKVKERTRQLIQAEKMASVGQLAAGLVHEIRNPLSGVKLSLQLMEGECDQKRCREDIQEISREIHRIENLLDRLLRFAKPHTPVFSPVDLNEVVRRTISLTQGKAKKASVEIVEDLKDGLPRVMADPDLMQQVFLNLILNAINAMPDGGRLVIGTRVCNGHVEVSFSDTGHGIPEDYMDKIFDPFFTTRGASGGSGLGLSISYRIVQEHRGELHVESTEGKGTTFRVRLKTIEDGNETDPAYSG